MATIRRLSDDDVRAVFEAVHNNSTPPEHLPFQIVPIGSDGLKLSPPSFQFEDGLYILLKPRQKKKSIHHIDQAKVPSKLMDCLMADIPEPNCPWSLSGPQFPQPTAIQQRYCYPKGDHHYSSQKGGALWTMYGTDGREDLQYRLLHVYFSAKRAVNKGINISSAQSISSAQKAFNKATKTKASPSPSFLLPAAKRTKRSSTPPITELQEMESMTMEDPFINVTPDINEFGRFHPVPDNSNSSSPVRPRAIHPWVHVANDLDAFQLDMEEPSLEELENCWSDPVVPNHFGDGDATRILRFAAKMDQIHESIKECIMLAAQDSEQGHLISLVSTWAKQVAASPLGEVQLSFEEV